MPSSATPTSRRETRSGSQTEAMLLEIKSQIESSKKEVINSLTGEIRKLKETIKDLSNRVVDLEEKYACLQENQNVMEDRITNECAQRRIRENNFIVFGLKENVTGTVVELSLIHI